VEREVRCTKRFWQIGIVRSSVTEIAGFWAGLIDWFTIIMEYGRNYLAVWRKIWEWKSSFCLYCDHLCIFLFMTLSCDWIRSKFTKHFERRNGR
jgi:hypothetical protein